VNLRVEGLEVSETRAEEPGQKKSPDCSERSILSQHAIPLHGRTTFERLCRKNVAKLTVMAARSEDVDHRSGQRTFGEKS